MGDSFSRILIQTTVRKAIRDIRETPQRSARNLIDMALNFSTGRFQQEFFQMAQKMLTDESSSYYALLQDMAIHIDEDKLLTFGMNVGYNGGILGAGSIRQLEESFGYNIPWVITLDVSRESLSQREARFHALIEEGEKMGIFTWILYSHECVAECIELAAQHPQSAFVVFFDHSNINWCVIDCASDLKNLMLVIPTDDNAAITCGLLREAGLLYSVYTMYGENDLHRLQNGDQFCEMEQLHPVFSVFIPEADCPEKVRKNAYDAIHTARMEQTHATILWELRRDCMMVDRVISGDGCWAGFDEAGILHGVDEAGHEKTVGTIDVALKELFCKAFSKG